jgi:hypothetical protein
MTETNFSWQSFLDHLAVEAGLASQETKAFKHQFDRQQENQSAKAIEESFIKKNSVEKGTYQSHIKRVYAKLINLGIDVDRVTAADKPGVVWQWLKQEYPNWKEKCLERSPLGVDALWSKLRNLGKYAPDRMGMFVAENYVEKAGALPEDYQPKPFLDEVPKGTQGLKFKIVSKGMGKVLLLNYDDKEKVVYCFCPSRFAPSMSLHRGETLVPQPESKFPYLGAKTLGTEEWWGWVVTEMPPLSWLEAAQNTALQLNTEQLAELLSQVESHEGEVLRTSYQVI